MKNLEEIPRVVIDNMAMTFLERRRLALRHRRSSHAHDINLRVVADNPPPPFTPRGGPLTKRERELLGQAWLANVEVTLQRQAGKNGCVTLMSPPVHRTTVTASRPQWKVIPGNADNIPQQVDAKSARLRLLIL